MERPFWFVGKHLALDFANTVVGTDRREALQAWSDVVRFLAGAGALDDAAASRLRREVRAEGAEAEAHAAALALRGLVRQIVVALAAGEPPPREAMRGLDARLADAASCPRLVRGEGGWSLEDRPLTGSWRAVLARIARAAAELVVSPRGAIRKCADPTCVLYFRDASRAQARRWCSMSACGNRAKVAAHAHRARSAGA